MNEWIHELRYRAAGLPRVTLAELPTPLQECRRLSAEVGHGVRLFLKRDDLTPLGFGGNKVRKMEFSMGKVKAGGYDAVVHGLAAQSNYCRQTAAICARLGLPCYLILRKDHKSEDPPQGNRLLSYLFGAHVTMVERAEQAEAKRRTVEALRAEGYRPYLVGYDDEVLGAVAYALALAEILEQAAALGARVDVVAVTGYEGTHTGLILGRRVLRFEGRVLGFCPTPAYPDRQRTDEILQIANDAARLLGYQEAFTAEDVHNTMEYAGPAYGVPTDKGLEAITLLARTEGMVVGPVYTGKGLSGVIDYVRTGRIAPGSTVVFVHTGGTPEIFAYSGEVAEYLGRHAARLCAAARPERMTT